jgi:hypothetical protein
MSEAMWATPDSIAFGRVASCSKRAGRLSADSDCLHCRDPLLCVLRFFAVSSCSSWLDGAWPCRHWLSRHRCLHGARARPYTGARPRAGASEAWHAVSRLRLPASGPGAGSGTRLRVSRGRTTLQGWTPVLSPRLPMESVGHFTATSRVVQKPLNRRVKPGGGYSDGGRR